MKFKNKTALITGVAGEMAQEMTLGLLREGGFVIGIDFSEEKMKMFADSLTDSDFSAFRFYHGDISVREKITPLLHKIISEHGKVDILINHVGATFCETLSAMTPEIWEKEIALNLNGTYYVTDIVLKSMKERKFGVIVTVSSVNAESAVGNPGYSAAKAALNSFSKSIAMEYGHLNIRSNVVSPGSVRTQAWNERLKNKPDTFENLARWYPLKRLATPKSISNAVLFLASDDADCISGENLRVDAGLGAGCALFATDITQQDFGV